MEPSRAGVYGELELLSSFVSIVIGNRDNESSTGDRIAQHNIV